MKSAVQFVSFQVLWFVAVAAAARGDPWLGFWVLAPYLALHAWLVHRAERKRELLFVIAVGVVGTTLDTVLEALKLTSYPSSEAAWRWVCVPPFISALWMAFATLPRFSLRWLAPRPRLAVALGACAGPLSYFAGVRLGATAVGAEPVLTWGVLSLEYAIVTPLLLRWAPTRAGEVARAK